MCSIRKILRTYFVLFSALTAIGIPASSQNYTITPGDSIVSIAPFDDVSVYNFLPVNNGSDTLFFFWKKLLVTTPSTWELSICDAGHCYSGMVDSSWMVAVNPGDAGLLSLHVNPHFETGIGLVQVVMSESHTANIWDTLTWIISANGPANVSSCSWKNDIQFFPNPVIDQLYVEPLPSLNTFYEIQNEEGCVIMQGPLQSPLPLSSLPNGTYWLHLQNTSEHKCFPLLKMSTH